MAPNVLLFLVFQDIHPNTSLFRQIILIIHILSLCFQPYSGRAFSGLLTDKDWGGEEASPVRPHSKSVITCPTMRKIQFP